MFHLTLNKKILFISLAGLITMSVCSLIIMLNIFSALEESKKHSLLEFSRELNFSIQDQFFERYGDVKAFAIRFMHSNQTREENENYLNQYSALYGIYDLILATDLKGNLLGVNSKDASGHKINSQELYNINFSDSSWFKSTINKEYLEDKSKGFEGVYFEDAHFDPLLEKVYGHKVYATIFSTFIYNDKGEPMGVVTTFANFIWIEALFQRLYDGLMGTGLNTVELTMLNKAGEIIIDYDPSAHDGDKKIVHDEKILNKLNLAKEGVVAAQLAVAGKEGVLESLHVRKKITQINVYNRIKGPKIVDSLGWSALIREDKDEFYATVNKIKYIALLTFLSIIILITVGSLLFSRSISKKISTLNNDLGKAGKALLSEATNLSDSSNELSAATTQQASALQETVAAITEINSMLAKTVEMTGQSYTASENNTQTIEEGKKAIQEMRDAISEIKKSNVDIFTQVDDGNKKITEIVQIISEIENKTRVINEIVFQTKLLSFNASVEAARAGEHGRGFAVVAEEVGNLAQMSGAASKEISVLLEQSTNKVKNIVDEISTQVSSLIKKATDKIEEGEKISLNCVESFEKISEKSSEIGVFINEITTSSKEQAKGVQEISQAMHELDTVTQQNSIISQRSSQSSTELLTYSKSIEKFSITLTEIVNGKVDVSSQESSRQNNKTEKPNKMNGPQSKRKINEKKPEKVNFNDESDVPLSNDPRFEEI